MRACHVTQRRRRAAEAQLPPTDMISGPSPSLPFSSLRCTRLGSLVPLLFLARELFLPLLKRCTRSSGHSFPSSLYSQNLGCSANRVRSTTRTSADVSPSFIDGIVTKGDTFESPEVRMRTLTEARHKLPQATVQLSRILSAGMNHFVCRLQEGVYGMATFRTGSGCGRSHLHQT